MRIVIFCIILIILTISCKPLYTDEQMREAYDIVTNKTCVISDGQYHTLMKALSMWLVLKNFNAVGHNVDVQTTDQGTGRVISMIWVDGLQARHSADFILYDDGVVKALNQDALDFGPLFKCPSK